MATEYIGSATEGFNPSDIGILIATNTIEEVEKRYSTKFQS